VTPTEYTVDVSSVLVTTGFDLLNPQVVDEYGYGEHPDVLTSMEYERLLDAAGPTEGHVVTPSDGEEPDDVLFVFCVGSRDQRHCEYCSRVCCMYSTKQAIQTVDHGVDDVTALYMDMRAYGKGFDGFYERARDEEGVDFRRSRPAEVDVSGDSPRVVYENTRTGEFVEEEHDMVVLAPAIIPSDGTPELAATLDVEVDDDGFFATTEDGGDMVETTRPGVYAAGCATGPKDIPDSVAEASGAASRALEHVEEPSWPDPVDVELIDATGEERIGVFVCHCGSNIADTVDVQAVRDYCGDLPNVEHSEDLLFACAGNTQEYIRDVVREKELNRVVIGSCSPKTHGPTFQETIAEAGLNEYLLEMANLRNHNSWVHDDERAATEKAKEMMQMAIDKAAFLTPLETIEQPIEQRALVVGGGIAGMSAAVSLAEQGHETHLVERDEELGGTVRDLDEIHPSGRDAADLLAQRREDLAEAGVEVHTGTAVETISGYIGNFAVSLSDDESLDVGAVVLATGADTHDPAETLGYADRPEVITNRDLEERLAEGEVDADRVAFVGCVGSRSGKRGCSRYCCQSMIGQANRLAEAGTHVDVVTKDVRTFTRDAEEAYRAAQENGVRFFRYDREATPGEVIDYDPEAGELVFEAETVGEHVALPTDLVVLATGLRSNGADVPDDVASQLTVTRDEEGFLLERHPKLGPVEASVGGVFLAGTAQAPRDVRDATDSALGTAAKAGALLSKDTVEQEPLAAEIDPEACVGCTRCADVCPYNAVEGDLQEVHEIIEAACMGCGTCGAACPQDTITMPGFTDEQIEAQIDAALADDPGETVITFACNWCSYGGADQAGIEKRTYPPSSRVIRTMCSGRVDEEFVEYAFDQGAGGVLMSGCHIGDCHYIDANHYTEERFERLKAQLERDEEFDEDRLQLAWISAAEGQKFADTATEMHDVVDVEVALESDGGCPNCPDGGCEDDASHDDWLNGGGEKR
jgi:heterodisulfide reductase subunit A